ncbi:MAG TPA: diguanylate cyclase, partial [Xanthobacteraceae bacterium]|nr:diguanylate cyclase [Xanthobacteraceae bacterium]
MPRQLAAMAAALVMLLALVAGILEPLEQRLSDAWFGLAKVAPSGRTVVVAFDHAPGPLGGARRVSRREVADLLMRLDAAGAARILVDIGLAEPMSPPEDNALERALARLGRKVGLTMNAVITVNQTTWRRSVVMERFARHATRTASDLGLDRDGRIRRSGIEDSGLPHLVPSPVWLNGPQPRRDEAPDVFRIDFGINLARIPHIDAATILQGGTTGLADANVIVAGYPPAAGKGAPVPRYDELSRAQVTALAAETLALGRTIRALPAWLSGAGAVAFAGLATLWCMRRRTLAAAALCAAAVLGATAVGAALQIFAGVLVPTVGIATAALLGFAAAQAMVHPAFQRLRQAAFAVVENIDIEALSRNATEDALTGVPNRRAFEQALQRACADGNGSFALLLCDLDGFKPINDTMGHQAGDALLREIA